MPKNLIPCPVCSLGEEVVKEIARMTLVGLPASDVVSFLGGKGHRLTQRQLVDHRRHAISFKSPRMALPPAFPPDSEMVMPEICINHRSSETGLSDLEREERLILGFLTATDRMLEALEQTGSIKISRAAVELGTLAAAMLKEKMSRPVEIDSVVNIYLTPINLEDRLSDFCQPEDVSSYSKRI